MAKAKQIKKIEDKHTLTSAQDVKDAREKVRQAELATNAAEEEYKAIFAKFAEPHLEALTNKIKEILGEDAVFSCISDSTHSLCFTVNWWDSKPLSREAKGQLTGWAEDYSEVNHIDFGLHIYFGED